MLDLMLTNIELRALMNSFTVSLGVSFFSVLLSLFLAISLSFYRLPYKRLFYFLFLIPLLIPPYLHAFSWMHLLMLFPCCGIEHLRSIPGVVTLLTISYFPVSFFIIYQAIRNIPQGIIDAAIQITKPSKVLRRIIIPSILPAILTASLLTFIITFITFDVPAFLGKNVFITQIFKSFTLTNEAPRALYLSSIPVFITGFIWALLLIFVIRDKPFFSLHSSQRSDFYIIKRSRPITFFILSVFLVIVLLSSFIPLGMLQLKSLLYEKTPFYTASPEGIIMNTLWISFISSVSIVISAILIYVTAYRKLIGRIIFLSLLIVPSITFGILFIYLFNQSSLNGIYATPMLLIIAYCFRFAPLVCELLYIHSQQINPQYFESARLVSVPFRRRVTMIYLPLYKPAIFFSWMFSFWLVATELPITLLVQPPGFQTVITRLFILLHYGAANLMSFLTLVLLSISFFPILVGYYFVHMNKTEDKTNE